MGKKKNKRKEVNKTDSLIQGNRQKLINAVKEHMDKNDPDKLEEVREKFKKLKPKGKKYDE